MAEFRTERKGDIIKCEYTVSGGIEGGAYSLRASKTGDKTAELAGFLSVIFIFQYSVPYICEFP